MNELTTPPVPADPSPPAAAPVPAAPEPRRAVWVAFALLRTLAAVPRNFVRYPGRSLAVLGLLVLTALGAGMAGVTLWGRYHLRAAREAVERYHTREAMPHLQACLKIWPHDAETLFLAARASRRMGALDEADHLLDQYQEARGKDDDDLLLERVLVRAERGELDGVRNFCQDRINQDHPSAPLILEALARGFARMYRPHEAEALIAEWLKRQPDNPQALLIQGEIHDLQTRQHDAVASYKLALTADPQLDSARLRLVETLMQLGLAGEALPHLEYLSRRFPNNGMVQFQLARAQDRLGNTEEAEKILADLLAREPNFAPALGERGKLALRAGRTVEAEQWLRQAITLDPGDAQSHYQLSLCLEKNGKTEEARKEQARLKEVEDDMRRIQLISTFLMQQSPDDPNLHYEAGVIALRAGSINEGLRWLHSALKKDPNHKPTHKALMEHYQRVGDLDRAAQHRRQAGLAEASPPAAAKSAKRP